MYIKWTNDTTKGLVAVIVRVVVNAYTVHTDPLDAVMLGLVAYTAGLVTAWALWGTP